MNMYAISLLMGNAISIPVANDLAKEWLDAFPPFTLTKSFENYIYLDLILSRANLADSISLSRMLVCNSKYCTESETLHIAYGVCLSKFQKNDDGLLVDTGLAYTLPNIMNSYDWEFIQNSLTKIKNAVHDSLENSHSKAPLKLDFSNNDLGYYADVEQLHRYVMQSLQYEFGNNNKNNVYCFPTA